MTKSPSKRVVNPQAAQSTAEVLDAELIRLLRVGLAANGSLFVSGASFLMFYARELSVEWWNRDVIGDVLYLLGFTTLFLSAVLEFWIDIGLDRKFGHGRYTTKRKVNLTITFMFLVGSIGDLIAFFFWRQGPSGIRAEHIAQWASSHMFLITAIAVLITNRPSRVPFQNTMDSIANVLFLGESILACCARYVSEIGDTQQNQDELWLEVASASCWMASAAFYVAADVTRLRDPDSLLY